MQELINICIYTSTHLATYICFSPSLHWPMHPSIHPFIHYPSRHLSTDVISIYHILANLTHISTHFVHSIIQLPTDWSIHPSIHFSICSSIHSFIYPPVYPPIYLSIYISIHLPTHSPGYPFPHPFIYLPFNSSWSMPQVHSFTGSYRSCRCWPLLPRSS